jgi:pyridoxamine 5'-phosphate oxidase
MEHIHDFLRLSRKDYGADYLDLTKITDDPFTLFAAWLEMAIEAAENEPHGMVLSTVDHDHRPSSRVVLLRGFSHEGMVFYSNYTSRKGMQMLGNPAAALNIYWPNLEKQVRIEGFISKLPEAESEAYFATRPRESQIGAWASMQSRPLSDRSELEQKVEFLTKEFEGKDVPKPPDWGGFRLKPDYFEFWQGRLSRLHDRMEYKLENDIWKITRLFP